MANSRSIPRRDRLIVALDVPSVNDARALIAKLGDEVAFYKLGLELFMSGGPFELVDWLVAHGKRVFVDLKFFDVPETVRGAVKALRRPALSAKASTSGTDNR